MVVAAPLHVMPFITPYFENCPFRAVITANEEDKKGAFNASQMAIVKSGTVALEVALAGAPMVVTYRVNPISAWLFRRVSLTKYANLVNIILGKEAIPELLQEWCDAQILANASAGLLDNPQRIQEQKLQCRSAFQQLNPPSSLMPSEMAASIVLKTLAS